MDKDKNKEQLTQEEVVETLKAFERALDIRDEQIKQGVFDIVQFNKGMQLAGAYTPYTQNELMKRMNISTNGTPKGQEIEEALSNPLDKEDNLINYSQSFYFSSFMYKRNQEYLANLPDFDLELSCINAELEYYKSKTYKCH